MSMYLDRADGIKDARGSPNGGYPTEMAKQPDSKASEWRNESNGEAFPTLKLSQKGGQFAAGQTNTLSGLTPSRTENEWLQTTSRRQSLAGRNRNARKKNEKAMLKQVYGIEWNQGWPDRKVGSLEKGQGKRRKWFWRLIG